MNEFNKSKYIIVTYYINCIIYFSTIKKFSTI